MRILALIAVAVVATNCAERPSSTVGRVEAVPPPAPTIESVPYRHFDAGVKIPWHSIDVNVRLLTKEEALEERPIGTAEGVALGSGALGIGTGAALLTPMAGGVFVGGVIIAPMVIYFGVQNDIWVERLKKAVADVDFLSRIREATAFKLSQASVSSQTIREPDQYRLEVVVSQYGIVGQCFGFVGSFSLWRGGKKAFEDGLNWEHVRRNVDFPPVRCASLSKFADEDARLFRETLIEASAVIAAVIGRRLRVTS